VPLRPVPSVVEVLLGRRPVRLGSLLPDEVVQRHVELLFDGVCHAVVGCWTGSLERGEERLEWKLAAAALLLKES
jgi:hypothetical protein